jgi:hypothetical protein
MCGQRKCQVFLGTRRCKTSKREKNSFTAGAVRRDVHETFQPETEIETFSPETETLANVSETRPWIGLETFTLTYR